jgi:hypothetical protein
MAAQRDNFLLVQGSGLNVRILFNVLRRYQVVEVEGVRVGTSVQWQRLAVEAHYPMPFINDYLRRIMRRQQSSEILVEILFNPMFIPRHKQGFDSFA